MVTLITGKINGGKTSRILELYLDSENGDGFASPKVFNGGELAGYDLQRLSTGETVPFIRREGLTPAGWTEAFTFGDFSFSEAGLQFASGIIKSAIEDGNSSLFIDEIGPVELQGKGFAPLLEKALGSGRDVYICVRESCVEDVAERFHIGEFALIKV